MTAACRAPVSAARVCGSEYRFRGVHSDDGGGCRGHGAADLGLLWMAAIVALPGLDLGRVRRARGAEDGPPLTNELANAIPALARDFPAAVRRRGQERF
jgi:hypothetical protein